MVRCTYDVQLPRLNSALKNRLIFVGKIVKCLYVRIVNGRRLHLFNMHGIAGCYQQSFIQLRTNYPLHDIIMLL